MAFAAMLVVGVFAILLGPEPRTIPPGATPGASSFSAEQVRHGRQLAAIGDCASCHTVAGGASFAGGVPIETPFGIIHGTNITPDRDTGIGTWTEEAFRRALREGISRDGQRLYPAFPYDHFTHLTDADIADLYAFVMTRDPVRAPPVANRLKFPFNIRPLVGVWDALYLREGPEAASPGPAQMQRGAYLVDALAHCSACHSPRNWLGAERRHAFLDGGEAEGWHAPALDAKSPSPVPWDARSLAAYLHTGLVAGHAMTAGPMQDVVSGLSVSDEQEVAAIAAYVASTLGSPTDAQRARESRARQRASGPLASLPPREPGDANDATLSLGRTVYQGSCASCHDAGRGLSSNSALQLPLAVALYLPKPDNLIRIVKDGIHPPDSAADRWMPPFAGNLSDSELTALVTWLRREATDQPDWQDVAKAVQQVGEPQ